MDQSYITPPAPQVPKQNWLKQYPVIVGAVVIVVLLILGSAAYFLYKQFAPKTSPVTSTTTHQSVSQKPTTALIEANTQGWLPATISVKLGDTVRWTNKDKNPHSVLFDRPQDYSSDPLQTNDTFSMTFEVPGTYTYHDISGTKFTGTVTVK